VSQAESCEPRRSRRADAGTRPRRSIGSDSDRVGETDRAEDENPIALVAANEDPIAARGSQRRFNRGGSGRGGRERRRRILIEDCSQDPTLAVNEDPIRRVGGGTESSLRWRRRVVSAK
jgi:hypothetical protein